MPETTPELVAATPPTVELVAALLTEVDGTHDGHMWDLTVKAVDNVITVTVTPYTEPAAGEESVALPKVRYRATVLPHPVRTATVTSDGDGYHYLRCENCGGIITLVEAGSDLDDLNDRRAAHVCGDDD